MPDLKSMFILFLAQQDLEKNEMPNQNNDLKYFLT
jgi:hypothetical protein